MSNDSNDDPYAQTLLSRPAFSSEPEAPAATASYSASALQAQHDADPSALTQLATPRFAPADDAGQTVVVPGVTRASYAAPAAMSHPSAGAQPLPQTPVIQAVSQTPAQAPVQRPGGASRLPLVVMMAVGVLLGCGVAALILAR
ncbi:MAG: hypothetical protein JNK72_14195 [Myxococcales bacterium]|nr:hypothetical protein [Myxococcales bacterium]